MDYATLGYVVKTEQLDAATIKLGGHEVAAAQVEKQALKTAQATYAQARAELELAKTTGTATAEQLKALGMAKSRAAAELSVARATVLTSKATGKAADDMSKFGGASANVFSQLNDIAVMMAAGQNPMQLAMQQGMQLNQVWGQLGGNIKSIGGAIGSAFMSMLNPINLVTIGVIAFGAAAVNWFMSAGGAAKTMAETIDDLTISTDEYIAASERSRMSASEMTAEFGRMEGAARAALSAIADAEKKAAIDALTASMRAVSSEALALEAAMGSGGKGVEAAIFNMGLARNEAISLKSAFDALNNAGTLEEQAAAAVALSDELNAARDIAGNLPDPLQRAYDALQLTVVEAARISGETEKAEGSIWDFVSATLQGRVGLSAMSSEASNLSGIVAGAAQNMWAMAQAASQARNAAIAAANAIPGMANPDPNATIDYNKELKQTAFLTGLVTNRVQTQKAALVGAGKAGGGAGGKISKGMKDAEKATAAADKAAKELQEQLDKPMISAIEGMSSAWGDFVSSGFKDFKGFIKSVKDSFVQSIADMAAYAFKNKIMISMGLGGAGGIAGTAASAATGGGGGLMSLLLGGGSGGGGSGGLGGLIGSFSGGAGGVLGGLLNGGLGGALKGLTTAIGGVSGGGLAGLAGAAGAIGAVAAGIGLVASFFKSKKTTLNAGFDITVKGLNTLVQTFQTIQKKKFWGLSKKVYTNLEAAEDGIANPIERAIFRVQKSVLENAKYLNVSADVFKNFTRRIWFSTKDMSADQVQAELMRRIQGLGNAFAGLVPGLASMKRNGEGLMDTLSRVVVQLKTVNATWRVLGFSLESISLKGAKAADSIVKVFGGVENFLQSTAFYFENFYTDQEKIAVLRRRIGGVLKNSGAGGAIPSTIEQYRAMIDDLESQGKDQAAAKLIKLAPLFIQLQDALGGVTNEVNSLKEALDPNDFAKLFDYQFAGARLLATGISPSKPGIYSAPPSAVATSSSPAVSQSGSNQQNNTASNSGAANNDAILLRLLQQMQKLTNINLDWNANGLPPERAA